MIIWIQIEQVPVISLLRRRPDRHCRHCCDRRGGGSTGEDLAAVHAHGLKSLFPVSNSSIQAAKVSNSSS